MTNGFTKLFNSIITSSIWSEDDKTRLMWVTMLATSDSKGFVSGTIPGMAAIARMSLSDAKKAIKKLESPDPYSRSSKQDGARISKCNDGWLITNYLRYRKQRDPEKRKVQNREAQQRFRNKKRAKKRKQIVSQNKPESAQAEAEAEAEERESLSYKQIFNYWNTKNNLTPIRKFTDQRKEKLKIRTTENLFVENWQNIIDKISASSFCTGDNERGWKADIDFLLANDTNYIKVLEGKYDDGKYKPETKPLERDGNGKTARQIMKEKLAKENAHELS